VDEDEVTRKVRPPEPSLKRHDGTSSHRLPRQRADEVTGEIVAGEEARLPDELEAELMVTKICDGILGRLNEAKTRRDQDLRKQRAGRPPG
jgi:hypothetical protein